jgi:hypothetical protein
MINTGIFLGSAQPAQEVIKRTNHPGLAQNIAGKQVNPPRAQHIMASTLAVRIHGVHIRPA